MDDNKNLLECRASFFIYPLDVAVNWNRSLI